jgi:hypothetical protein
MRLFLKFPSQLFQGSLRCLLFLIIRRILQALLARGSRKHIKSAGLARWPKPVTLAIWEAEFWRIMVLGQPGQKVHKISSA